MTIEIPWIINPDHLIDYYGMALKDKRIHLKTIDSAAEAIEHLTKVKYPLIIATLDIDIGKMGINPDLDRLINEPLTFPYEVGLRTIQRIHSGNINRTTPILAADFYSSNDTSSGKSIEQRCLEAGAIEYISLFDTLPFEFSEIVLSHLRK